MVKSYSNGPSVPDYILKLKPYLPGKPIEALEREYGIHNAVKLASNENPLGPSPKAVAAMRAVLATVNRYPDDGGHDLVHQLADYLHLSPDTIILGNGSDELLTMLTRAFLQPGDNAIIPQPTFLMYESVVRWNGAESRFVPLKDLSIDLEALLDNVNERTRMVFLCNPNNPTGTIFNKASFDTFLDRLSSRVVVVLDEAYGEFVQSPDYPRGTDYIDHDRAIVTLRTFSKIYGLAGLRIGYGLMAPNIVRHLHRVRIPFNVNLPAQAAAVAALKDHGFRKKTRQLVQDGLKTIAKALDDMGIEYFPTEANFFLINVKTSADDVYEALLRQGVIVRSMAAYGYSEYIRVNIGLPEENKRLIDALAECKTILSERDR